MTVKEEEQKKRFEDLLFEMRRRDLIQQSKRRGKT
jgi:hypothetical protein